jgi:hypothetical protein
MCLIFALRNERGWPINIRRPSPERCPGPELIHLNALGALS